MSGDDGDGRRAARILGIDLGERRIGLAIAERGGLVGAAARDGQPRAIAGARGRRPHAGEGRRGAGDRGARRRAAARGERRTRARWPRPPPRGRRPSRSGSGCRVTLRDERLSSHLAESRLGPMPRGRSGGPPSKTQRDRYRERVDREAAAIILQDELDARRDAGRVTG